MLALERDDIRVYLQILQSAISKIGMNSLYCKTLCLTLTGSFGFAGKLSCYTYIVSLMIIILCMIVDATYLSLERSYRDKYNNFIKYYDALSKLRGAQEGVFDMDPGDEYKKIINIIKSMKSWTIYLVYPVPAIYMTAMFALK